MDPTGRSHRLGRIRAIYEELGIGKEEWMEKTGFSERQWYSWHSESGASPHLDNAVRIFARLDLSPVFVWYGLGPKRLSEFNDQVDAQEIAHMIEEIHEKVVK